MLVVFKISKLLYNQLNNLYHEFKSKGYNYKILIEYFK